MSRPENPSEFVREFRNTFFSPNVFVKTHYKVALQYASRRARDDLTYISNAKVCGYTLEREKRKNPNMRRINHKTLATLALATVIMTACGSVDTEPPELQEAKNLLSQNKLKEGLAKLNEVVKKHPDNVNALVNQAQTNVSIRDYNGAIESYSKLIELQARKKDTSTPPSLALSNRGACFIKIGEYQKALDDFNQAIKVDPNQQEMYELGRASAFAKMGEYQKCIDECNAILNLKAPKGPQNESYFAMVQGEAYAERARAYKESGREDLAAKDRAKLKELGYAADDDVFKD